MATVDATIRPHAQNDARRRELSAVSSLNVSAIDDATTADDRRLERTSEYVRDVARARGTDGQFVADLDLHPALRDARPLPSPALSSASTDNIADLHDAATPRRAGHLPSPALSNGPFAPASYSDATSEGLRTPLSVSRTLSSQDLRLDTTPTARKLSAHSRTPSESRPLKLSHAELKELMTAPEMLSLPPVERFESMGTSAGLGTAYAFDQSRALHRGRATSNLETSNPRRLSRGTSSQAEELRSSRPLGNGRAFSTSSDINHNRLSWPRLQTQSPPRRPRDASPRPDPLEDGPELKTPHNKPRKSQSEAASPQIPTQIPLPPMAIPTYLQLELSTTKPSPLFIYRSAADDIPFESSRIKFERLLNFLLLPPQLEQVLFFGTMACLDAWIHTFTILPIRFIQAVGVLLQWWAYAMAKEARYITEFIYYGLARMYERRKDRRGRRRSVDSTTTSRSASQASRPSVSTPVPGQSRRMSETVSMNGTSEAVQAAVERKLQQATGPRRHRRSRSHPSALSPSHKSDLLQGLVVACTCVVLMRLDASRMYHSIRGQTDIKLYVIYNVLEVGDKLLSALGQDILECLNSNETLERKPNGRSKILRPFGMFLLALIYNIIHTSALFYQVVTLNVAVNAYSNALLTLLLSNQFVEIKSTVFKKFEKENLFQLTCADVVERLQLWIMLLIIALRNVVEVGGFSMLSSSAAASSAAEAANATSRSFSFLPNSFTILPHWAGEVLSPFLIVLGSEMLVDWVKHAYIIKFNNVKPAVYRKFLDVLAKDYYTNAFVNQNLTKRVGLPVLPLSCLFIRASVQTYHMFIAMHVPPPIPSTATALAVESAATTSPATTAALERFDDIIRRALGRSVFGVGVPKASGAWGMLPDADDAIAVLTMLVFFLGAFMVLLAFKLVLGMFLLKFARNRYSAMQKRHEKQSAASLDTHGRRIGGWGMIELDEEKRKIIYDDDPDGAKALRDKDRKAKERLEKGTIDFGKVTRYEMAAKRIW